MSKHAAPFEWSGGHPALDFVNTLDERPFDQPIENLATYRDLVRFTELAGLIEPTLARKLGSRGGPATLRVARQARVLREHLYNLLAAAHGRQRASRRDLDSIAAAVRSAHAARVLMASPSNRLASHCWSRSITIDIPVHVCALAVERLLTDVDRGRIKKCRASDCAVYFIDTSKAHRRQWCSMANCGNREKQRRWRSTRR